MKKTHTYIQKAAEVFAPLHEFKDCSIGTREQRWAALQFNKTNAWRLTESMKNCALLSIVSFTGLWILDFAATVFPVAYVQMCLGILVALGAVGLCVQAVMYAYLKYVKVTFN